MSVASFPSEIFQRVYTLGDLEEVSESVSLGEMIGNINFIPLWHLPAMVTTADRVVPCTGMTGQLQDTPSLSWYLCSRAPRNPAGKHLS